VLIGAHPRILDVASRAGVSTATVSRVLNGVDSVAVDHRERVLAAVDALGYRPNRLARNLRKTRTDMIGVVASDIENPHFAAMVRAAEDEAYRRGYRVLLCNTDESPEKQASYLEILAGERVRGVILVPSDPAGREITHLLDLGIPVVAFDRRVEDPRADAVLGENVGAARIATEHLLQLGRRQLGFMGGPDKTQTARERRSGYELAMRAHDLEPRLADGGFRIGAAATATGTLLDRGPLDGLVVANNLMAIGVLETLRARRIAVPEDVALVAFDDPFWADFVQPALTTLAQPIRRMVESAIRLLLERIDGDRSEPERMVFDFELRVRDSSRTEPRRQGG
jgi:LacI family transcriptional regulator